MHATSLTVHVEYCRTGNTEFPVVSMLSSPIAEEFPRKPRAHPHNTAMLRLAGYSYVWLWKKAAKKAI
ncbi:hypothetical protein GGI01_003186 [Coemansia sp. RSA 376]|nr:hypothetical protein GGI01_003186 [Coemansia sp. RSA 376]